MSSIQPGYIAKSTSEFSPIPKTPNDKKRLAFLDALRGLAAAYVIVYHMLLIPQPNLMAPKWIETFAMSGGTGVTLFFVISAFSLCYTMPLRLKEKYPIRLFYLHRFFRIAPLFYCWIAATLIRDIATTNYLHPLAEVIASITFLFNFVPNGQSGFVWASWTIGVEMIFYALFPFIYNYVKTIKHAIIFVFLCLIFWLLIKAILIQLTMPSDYKQSILQFSTFKYFPGFAMGILVYHLYKLFESLHLNSLKCRIYGSIIVCCAIVAFAMLLLGWLIMPSLFGTDSPYYAQSLIYGLLLLGFSLSPWSLFINAMSNYFGKISFSMYLSHPSVVYFLTPVYTWLYQNMPNLTISFLCSLLITFLIVIFISDFTYRFIEKPGIILGHKMANRLLTETK
ncbi:MAG: acyltransferase [Methylobacter sp.]|nr:acyltransferase [Methylobacter sp.]